MPSVFTGSLIFSHILPVLLGFIGVTFLISGIMDENYESTKIGVVLFIMAALMPFLILSLRI